MIQLITDHFFHVVPILVAGVLAVSIMVERFFTLFKTYSLPDGPGFNQKINEFILQGKLNEALAYCLQFPGKPSAHVAQEALKRAHQTEDLIQSAIELIRNRSVEKIQKRTHYLATIANVSTLLGLLGTIAGLIQSFGAVGSADPQQKAQILSNGISTAMNATLMGLGVAVPCMIVFSLLMNKANQILAELDDTSLTVLDSLMTLSFEGAPEQPPSTRSAS